MRGLVVRVVLAESARQPSPQAERAIEPRIGQEGQPTCLVVAGVVNLDLGDEQQDCEKEKSPGDSGDTPLGRPPESDDHRRQHQDVVVALGDRRQRHAEGGQQSPGQGAGIPSSLASRCSLAETLRATAVTIRPGRSRAAGGLRLVWGSSARRRPRDGPSNWSPSDRRSRSVRGRRRGQAAHERTAARLAARSGRGEDRHAERGDSGCREDAPPACRQQERPEPDPRHLEHQHESQRYAGQPDSSRIRMLPEIQHSAEKKKQQRVALSLSEIVRKGNVRRGQRRQPKPGSDPLSTGTSEGLHQKNQPRPPPNDATNDSRQSRARAGDIQAIGTNMRLMVGGWML